MPLIALLVCITIFIGGITFTVQRNDIDNHNLGELNSIATSMIIYHNHASEFAKANPTYSGHPTDSDLNLPNWYHKLDGISSYIRSGSSYVYYARDARVAGVLAEKTESMAVGFKRDGVLHSTKHGPTNITIPSQVPDDSVVYVQ